MSVTQARVDVGSTPAASIERLPVEVVDRRRTRARTAAFGTLLIVGAALRVWRLGAQRLGFDEAFTAMTARRSPGSMFAFLRVADSHPPLSYLWRAPFAVTGVSDFWIRFPSVVCSIAALVLFACWMRRHGTVGLIGTALFAVSAFQVLNGRHVRMYAELELIGVAAALVAESWVRRPRRWHAPAIGVLMLVGLLTHVSMFLLGAGLLVLAGRRTDRDAWRWRVALAAALVAWALLWGPSFLAQAQAGHSDWIPRTSFSGFVHAVGQLATPLGALHLAALCVIAVGGVLLWRHDRVIAKVWTACFAVPVVLAAGAGCFAPVLLDRTLTVVSWGALFSIAVVIDVVVRRVRWVGVVAAVVVVALSVPSLLGSITRRSTPDVVLRHLEAIAAPGDVIGVHPARRRPEIVWPFAVTLAEPTRAVRVPQEPLVAAIELGAGTPSGRVWMLEWRRRSTLADGLPRCAPDWSHDKARVICLELAISP